MQSEQEIKRLKEELEKLTGFIDENGSAEPFGTRDHQFGCDVCDALAWVLGEISTDQFRSGDYLNIPGLKQIALDIETATGKKLANYE